ncbi:MAG: DUF6089 family protein [Wenyingzhuangia sp.]|uniref:DUF6089 family protein n=1 Tax=Wenyingzhuangia sp. TaxID=1964193 RepID=UPI003218E4AE
MPKFFCVLVLLIANIGFSQVYEIGISHNQGSLVGEKYNAFPINATGGNWGIIVKKNMNPRIAYRLAANSLENKDTKLTELSGGIDFNFTEYNPIRLASPDKGSAYLIFELTTLFYDTDEKSLFSMALPLGVGYKKILAKHVVCSLETKGRISFTDDLDNISTNKSTLDAYYYIGASIYYTFGWPRGSKNQIRF